MTTMTKKNGTTEFDSMFENLMDEIFTPVKRGSRLKEYSYIEQNDDLITLYINATGLGKDDIEIKYRDGHLIIKSNLDEEELTPLVRNIGHRFRVPKDFKGESATAHFKNGILTISLEKDEEKTKETVIKIN